jgi:septum formation protein
VTLILASQSGRRVELLRLLGVAFDVRPAHVDETPRPGEPPDELVRRLAVDKALAALDAAPGQDVVVLAADTEVVVDDEVLGKPSDAADAARMLRLLSNRTHLVVTGVAVASRGPSAGGDDHPRDAGGEGGAVGGGAAVLGPAVQVAVESVATEVTMVELTDEEVAWYVATGEPLDKAGAYGLQGAGAAFVSSIRGSWDSVVGLPLVATRRLLTDAGVPSCPAR